MREPKKVRTRPELVKSCRALRVFNAELKEQIEELQAKLDATEKKLRDMQATIATFNIV